MATFSGVTLVKVSGTKFSEGFGISTQMLILHLMIMRFYHPTLQNVILLIWTMSKLISLGYRKWTKKVSMSKFSKFNGCNIIGPGIESYETRY